ncbi:MAG: hypothetical protein GX220_06890 [Treponema sp.]|nr:hypothetical protein [Treponema sp.]
MEILKKQENNLISQFVDASMIRAMETLVQNEDINTSIKASYKISELFGSKNEFSVLVENSSDTLISEEKLITSFNNNLNLLVQKIWVEKADEALKEQILARIETLCSEVKKNIYTGSYNAFISVLHDVVFLMFGNQAKKEDFTEYALRIDPGFGIFWWYVENLPLENSWTNEKTRIVMLLAMFFLANY